VHLEDGTYLLGAGFDDRPFVRPYGGIGDEPVQLGPEFVDLVRATECS
jgi:hypothetical protein